jgi:hypothetical protein
MVFSSKFGLVLERHQSLIEEALDFAAVHDAWLAYEDPRPWVLVANTGLVGGSC